MTHLILTDYLSAEDQAAVSAYLDNPRDVLYLERIGDTCTAQLTTSGTLLHLSQPLPDDYGYVHGFGRSREWIEREVDDILYRIKP